MKLVIVMLLALLGGCDCAYGGPGCGAPALVGLCERDVPLGESLATISFWDDTGLHPAKFAEVHAVPADRVFARPGDGDGAAQIVGRETGPIELRFERVVGWEAQTFYFSLEVTATAVPPDDECFLEPDA